MISHFVCEADGCPNQSILYRMEDATATAMCGGCGVTLIGTPEQEEENNG